MRTQQSPPPPRKLTDIEIRIDSTRPRLIAGTGFGITAEVTNKSDAIIYLHEKYITLVLPPELQTRFIEWNGYGYFPTEDHPKTEDWGKFWGAWIAIEPGKSYEVFWFPNPPERSEKFFGVFRNLHRDVTTELNYVFFEPGNYTVSVVAKYWVHPKKPLVDSQHTKIESQTRNTGGLQDDYQTKIESKTFSVDAPQSVILFGAMLGGLISYFLFPQARKQFLSSVFSKENPHGLKKAFMEIAGMLGAGLMSIIITILLARISETQFLLKVTVADFWGAVAIGFVANYAGHEVLNKIIDRYLNKQAVQKKANENISSS